MVWDGMANSLAGCQKEPEALSFALVPRDGVSGQADKLTTTCQLHAECREVESIRAGWVWVWDERAERVMFGKCTG